MGIYSEYLDRHFSFQDMTAERKRQLERISELRDRRDVLVYAADLSKGGQAPIGITYDDLLPITDQLANLSGRAIDVILETPGGSAEVAEDIVKLLRGKYQTVSFIVPGTAKSAGTIMVMAGDEILMDARSSLGPIDAQIQWQGKTFSADAFLKGLEKIKDEVIEKNFLNRAYIPMLQGISPGEIQNAENALKFSEALVSSWLNRYKFRTWTAHSRTGSPVTEEEKEQRALEIAKKLCEHGRWLTHARSIKLQDLEEIGLRITDYGTNEHLSDAIHRYYALLQMTFDTNVYKVIETPDSQIYRFFVQRGAAVPRPQGAAQKVVVEMTCGKCGKQHLLQADFDRRQPLQAGVKYFPNNDILVCDQCQTAHNLGDLRRQIELQAKREVVRE